MSLRTRLLLIVAGAALPFLLLLLYDASLRLTEEREATRSEALRASRACALNTGYVARESHELLKALAQLPEIRRGNPAECALLLAALLRQYDAYANLSLWSLSGDVIASAVPQTTPVNASDRQWFKDAIATRGFVGSEFFVGRIVGQPILVFALPVVDEAGAIRSLVATSMRLDWLGLSAARAPLPDGSLLLILDRNGTVIARAPRDDRLIGRPAPEGLAALGSDSVGEGAILDAETRIVAVASVSTAAEAGLRVAVGIPSSAALQRTRNFLTTGLLLLGLVLVVALAIAWAGSTFVVVRPVQSLLGATQRLSQGDLAARAGIRAGGGELDRLALAFDEMAMSLESRQEALRMSEERLRALIEVAPIGIGIIRRGMMIAINRAGLRMLGYDDPSEIIGRSMLEATIAPESRESVAAIAQARQQGLPAPDSYEAISMRKDGSRFPVLIQARSHELSDGPAVIGFITDLTEQKRAQEALRTSEERFRSLVEGSPIAVGIHRAGKALFGNAAFLRLFGYARVEDLLAQPMYQQLAPSVRNDVVRRGERRDVGGPEPTSYETIGLRRDGTEFPILVQVVRIGLSDGPATVLFAGDLTEQKRAEEALRASEERLRQTLKMEAIGRLAGGVAHDFNNLLQVISGFTASLLVKIPPDSAARHEAEEIARAAARAGSLTRQLLAFGRRQVLEPRVLDLNAIVADMVGMLQRLLGEDIDLATALDAGAGRVRADRSQLEQVLLNLAANARDAMPRGGTLRIATRTTAAEQPGPWVALEVADTGQGMDPATLAHLFEPFFTTKEIGKGTGLGLATVYGIVAQSGGHIAVESAPGKGTLFRILLPQVSDPAMTEAPCADARPPGGSELILVVEDEEGIRHFVVQALRLAGYRTLEAGDGAVALEVAARHDGTIDLVLADVVLPRLNGPDVASRLLDARPGLRVLFMSGHTGSAEVADGSLLEKPFAAEQLLTRVRNVLDG